MSDSPYVSVEEILSHDTAIRKQFGSLRSVRKLHGGARSLVSLVTAARGKFILKRKISGERNYDIEYTNLAEHVRTRITPKAYAQGTIDNTNYIAIEYVPGKRLPKRGMDITDVKAAATVLNKVLKPAPGVADLIERLTWDGSYAKKWMREAQKYAPLRKDALQAERMYEKLPAPKTIPVRNRYRHGDPNPHNFIKNGRRIMLIDWDNHSKPGPGEIELADFALKAHLSAAKREKWMKSFPWCNREAFELGYQYRLASLIGWHFERLVRDEQGTFPGPFYGGNRQAEMKTMRGLIIDLERAVR